MVLKLEQNHYSDRKKLFQSSRTYAVKWQFLAENQPSSKLDRSDTQEQSMLSDST
jgi:hypothetical protein